MNTIANITDCGPSLSEATPLVEAGHNRSITRNNQVFLRESSVCPRYFECGNGQPVDHSTEPYRPRLNLKAAGVEAIRLINGEVLATPDNAVKNPESIKAQETLRRAWDKALNPYGWVQDLGDPISASQASESVQSVSRVQ